MEQILNEAFASKALSKIQNGNQLGKDLLKGLDKYDFALSELKDGVDIIEVDTSDNKDIYDLYTSLHNADKKKQKSQNARSVGYDVLFVDDNGLVARLRTIETGRSGFEILEMIDAVKKIYRKHKGTNNKLAGIFEYMQTVPSTKAYVLDNSAWRKNFSKTQLKKNIQTPENDYRKTPQYAAEKIAEKKLKAFFGVPGFDVSILNNNGSCTVMNGNDPICEIQYSYSSWRAVEGEEYARKYINISGRSSVTSIGLDDKKSIDRLKGFVSIVDKMDKQYDEYVKIISAISNFLKKANKKTNAIYESVSSMKAAVWSLNEASLEKIYEECLMEAEEECLEESQLFGDGLLNEGFKDTFAKIKQIIKSGLSEDDKKKFLEFLNAVRRGIDAGKGWTNESECDIECEDEQLNETVQEALTLIKNMIKGQMSADEKKKLMDFLHAVRRGIEAGKGLSNQ